ncbi:MAG: PilT/PilU family type 4a pilus ATPase [Syntrophales bacterium]|jgi:pilus retraction protein PilT|nr:PilT/PilU family type 4a pilus ATPase [Syntrophales bacterium]
MKRFQKIIDDAIKDVASDVYLTGGHPLVSRKHGTIKFHNDVNWSHQEIDALINKLLSPKQLNLLRHRKSLDYAMSVSCARLRINFFTTVRGLSLAIRILPGHIPTIDELNLHPSLHEISKLKSGLILTCGATGVGKTTTVASIINNINNTRRAHIITLENPIEYRFSSGQSFIQQRELGPHMPSFAQGLIDVLRENPDVIVVGELREPETMQLTLNAAESGHLVIATLHASNPEEAIYRLCNAVPIEAQNEVRYQLASTLSWLITQQLVYMEKVKYRVPLLSIVRGTQSVKNIIRENKLPQLNSAIQMGKNEGMFTTERYFSEYLENHSSLISYEKAFRPSKETVQDAIYQSPLTEDKPEAVSRKWQATMTGDEPIIVRTPYSHNEMETMLTIDEDVSLQELISKMR